MGWFVLGVIIAEGDQNRIHLVMLKLSSPRDPQKRTAMAHSDPHLEIIVSPAKLLMALLLSSSDSLLCYSW